jgi:hypothetical protein
VESGEDDVVVAAGREGAGAAVKGDAVGVGTHEFGVGEGGGAAQAEAGADGGKGRPRGALAPGREERFVAVFVQGEQTVEFRGPGGWG